MLDWYLAIFHQDADTSFDHDVGPCIDCSANADMCYASDNCSKVTAHLPVGEGLLQLKDMLCSCLADTVSWQWCLELWLQLQAHLLLQSLHVCLYALEHDASCVSSQAQWHTHSYLLLLLCRGQPVPKSWHNSFA